MYTHILHIICSYYYRNLKLIISYNYFRCAQYHKERKNYFNSIPANILFPLLLVSFPPVAFFNIYTHAQSIQLLHKNNSI